MSARAKNKKKKKQKTAEQSSTAPPRPPPLAGRWRAVDAPPPDDLALPPADALLESTYTGLEELSETETAQIMRQLEGDADSAGGSADVDSGDADDEAHVLAVMRRRMRAQLDALRQPGTADAASTKAQKQQQKQQKQKKKQKQKKQKQQTAEQTEEAKARQAQREAERQQHYDAAVQRGRSAPVRDASELLAWAGCGLHPRVLGALAALGFTEPTPVQRRCVPLGAVKRADVIGAAETGSGVRRSRSLSALLLNAHRAPLLPFACRKRSRSACRSFPTLCRSASVAPRKVRCQRRLPTTRRRRRLPVPVRARATTTLPPQARSRATL